MVTDKKLLELVFNSALCYIPTETLDEDQLEKLDNISYRWCKCKRCTREYTILVQYSGHANKKTLEIRISRKRFREELRRCTFRQILLLELISVTLHEIIHILFPELNEEQVEKKTKAWISDNYWSAAI